MGATPLDAALVHLEQQAVARMLAELRAESVLRSDFSPLLIGNDSPLVAAMLVARYVSRHYPHVIH